MIKIDLIDILSELELEVDECISRSTVHHDCIEHYPICDRNQVWPGLREFQFIIKVVK
jgi:hypothetical protein